MASKLGSLKALQGGIDGCPGGIVKKTPQAGVHVVIFCWHGKKFTNCNNSQWK
jgi:hypothetical protein